MIQYKDKAFYDDYFRRLTDFKLIQPFKKSTKKDEKNILVGSIEYINKIYKIVISVNIPVEFPHKKLMFWTDSLRGYPHLIYDSTKKSSWFCLNTPFAETAENQLDEEFSRLRGWLKMQVRKDRPAIIDDPEVIMALRKADAYSWENSDEMDEYRGDAWLTFIGDFYKNPKSFKKKGKLTCIKNGSNLLFALPRELKKHKNTIDIPYVIVDEEPINFHDFVIMKKQYGWDKDICDFLLPDFNLDKNYFDPTSYSIEKGSYSEEECEKLIGEAIKYYTIPVEEQETFNNAIEHIRKNVKKQHGASDSINVFDVPPGEDPETYWAEQQYYIDLYERQQHELHFFAIATNTNEELTWFIFNTNKACGTYENHKYDLKFTSFSISKLKSFYVDTELAQNVDYKHYFGRGAFCQKLANAKVAIIGLGAIGSIVAQSLARGGVLHFGLWDEDVIEPGNICRSGYDASDLGESKVTALADSLYRISPFCEVKSHGFWDCNFYGTDKGKYYNGSFYGEINYLSQSDSLKQLEDYDLIIDCTASNELLHFLSYSLKDKDVISLCITNHANNLLCISNNDGNPFELRKVYLSKIEQDTKNFYAEGTGCYSPTFLATGSDIATLTNLAVRDINKRMTDDKRILSSIYSYSDRGIVADRLIVYKLQNMDISLIVSSETLMDGEDLADADNGPIGFLLGGYSRDGKTIMVTHFISSENANLQLRDAWNVSQGIIDYIGDFRYSNFEDSYKKEDAKIIFAKAQDEEVDTNNPLLAIRKTTGEIDFYLFIKGGLKKFEKVGN